LIDLLLLFLTPVLNSQGLKKITLCNTKKYKNQAGMNLLLHKTMMQQDGIVPLNQNGESLKQKADFSVVARLISKLATEFRLLLLLCSV